MRILRAPRLAALILIAVLIGLASAASFAESYRGLYEWAAHHGLPPFWAAVWPVQVDVFIAVGELALFVALIDGWTWRQRLGAWAATIVGLAVSVAGNVGHIASHAASSRGTAAVPPLAAASALAVGLGVLKRVVAARRSQQVAARPDRRPAAVTGTAQAAAKVALEASAAASNPLSVRQLVERFGLGRADASRLHAEVIPKDAAGAAGSDPRTAAPAALNGSAPGE
jgi:uncharacterized small protein (DUF1192 family)